MERDEGRKLSLFGKKGVFRSSQMVADEPLWIAVTNMLPQYGRDWIVVIGMAMSLLALSIQFLVLGFLASLYGFLYPYR